MIEAEPAGTPESRYGAPSRWRAVFGVPATVTVASEIGRPEAASTTRTSTVAVAAAAAGGAADAACEQSPPPPITVMHAKTARITGHRDRAR